MLRNLSEKRGANFAAATPRFSMVLVDIASLDDAFSDSGRSITGAKSEEKGKAKKIKKTRKVWRRRSLSCPKTSKF